MDRVLGKAVRGKGARRSRLSGFKPRLSRGGPGGPGSGQGGQGQGGQGGQGYPGANQGYPGGPGGPGSGQGGQGQGGQGSQGYPGANQGYPGGPGGPGSGQGGQRGQGGQGGARGGSGNATAPGFNGGGSGNATAPGFNGGSGNATAPGGSGSGNATAPGFNGGSGNATGPGGRGGRQGFPGGPGGPNSQPEKEPDTFIGKSQYAFRNGRSADAFQYLYAHYLTDPSGTRDQDLVWIEGLQAPRHALQIGVAVKYVAPSDFEKRPPVIGGEPNIDTSTRSRGGRNGRSGPGGPGGQNRGNSGFGGRGGGGRSESAPSDPIGKLDFYTASLGNMILEELDARRTSNKALHGKILKDVKFELNLPSNNRGGRRGGQGGSQGFNGGGAGGGGMLDEGNFNPGQRNNSGRGFRGRNKAEDQGQLIPGVSLVGVGTSDGKLKDAADSFGVDLLILFDVKVAVNRKTTLESNTTKVSVIDMSTRKAVYTTRRSLANVAVWKAQEKGQDPIEDTVKALFKSIDESYVASAMPEWNQEDYVNRVKSISRSKKEYSNPLPLLAEITYYFNKKKLEAKYYDYTVKQLLGKENGEEFLKGKNSDKVSAIADWLPPTWEPDQIGGSLTNR